MNTSPEDHLDWEESRRSRRNGQESDFVSRIYDEFNERDRALPIGPLPDDGKPRKFYPVSNNFSLVTRVPGDVLPEWLAFAHEAAVVLRDRSVVSPTGPDSNRNKELGAEIVSELEKRFPHLRESP